MPASRIEVFVAATKPARHQGQQCLLAAEWGFARDAGGMGGMLGDSMPR